MADIKLFRPYNITLSRGGMTIGPHLATVTLDTKHVTIEFEDRGKKHALEVTADEMDFITRAWAELRK